MYHSSIGETTQTHPRKRDIMNLQFLKFPESLGAKPKFKKPANAEFDAFAKDILERGGGSTISYVYNLSDYDQLAESAQSGLDVEAIMEFAPEEIHRDDLVAVVSMFNEALASHIPVNSSVTLFGVDERPPSDFEKSVFVREMRVLADPSHILELMKADQLSYREVDMLKQFYPEYYQELSAAILEAVSAHKTDKPVSARLNRTLSILFGVPRVTPSFVTDQAQEDQGSAKADFSAPSDNAKTEIQDVLEPQ